VPRSGGPAIVSVTLSFPPVRFPQESWATTFTSDSVAPAVAIAGGCVSNVSEAIGPALTVNAPVSVPVRPVAVAMSVVLPARVRTRSSNVAKPPAATRVVVPRRSPTLAVRVTVTAALVCEPCASST